MRKLAVVIVLLTAHFAATQCIRVSNTVTTVGRNFIIQAVPLANVRLCSSATGVPCPAATVYTNSACTNVDADSTVQANQYGNYVFYALSGKYAFQFSGAGLTTFTEPDVRLSPSGPEISAGIGSVSNVAMSVPSTLLSVTGSPITTTGTFAVALVNFSANTFLAGPTSGAAAQPTRRVLNLLDMPAGLTALLTQDPPACGTSPAQKYVTDIANDGTLTCGQVNFTHLLGIATIAQGGTGQSTAPDDNVLLGNGTLWQLKSIPDCLDTAGQHINYDAATNTLSCGTSGGSAGTAPVDATYLAASVNNTLTNEMVMQPGENLERRVGEANANGGNYTFDYDPTDTTTVLFQDEFGVGSAASSGSIGVLGWSTATIAGTPVFSKATGTFPNVGLENVATTAVVGDGGTLCLGSTDLFTNLGTNTNWFSVFVFRLNSTATVRFRIGFLDNCATIQPAAGAWLRYDTSAGFTDAAFKVECRAASVSTVGGTTYAVDTAFHRLRITSTTAGTFVFQFDNNTPQSLASNCPTVDTVAGFVIATDTTAAKNADIDYFGFKWKTPTR